MRITGAVAEFNPFHLGHQRFLREAKKETGADYCAVVMSGAFTERGDCAVFSAASRTAAALRCGADIVLELPVRTACAGAEDFTFGSVYALHSLGCIDSICFGSESGDTEELERASAAIKRVDPEAVDRNSPHRNGTYAGALGEYLISIGEMDAAEVMAAPNNVLGMGYISALGSLNNSIRPYTVKRDRSDGDFPSSSEIRSALSAGDQDFADRSMPPEMLEQIPDTVKRSGILRNDDFSLILMNEILLHTADELSSVYECSPELARRIKKLCRPGMSYSDLVMAVKSKHLTESRVRRVLTHIFLGICGQYEPPRYVRLLGYRRGAEEALSEIGKKSLIPVIARLSDLKEQSDPVKRTFEETERSHALWEEAWYLKYGELPSGIDRVITTD